MPAIHASAPGKIILVGEHAVVYGRPAIAIPVAGLQAHAYLFARPDAPPGQVHIQAPDIQLDTCLADLPPDHPFSVLFHLLQQHFQLEVFPAVQVRIRSDIPIASGLGSGTAVSVALIRAATEFIGERLPDDKVSRLAYEVEKVYHGTPSGIDNTVVTYARAIYFVRGAPPETLLVKNPLTFLIADSGMQGKTAAAVGHVRAQYEKAPDACSELFDNIGQLSAETRRLMADGNLADIGACLTANQQILQQLGVSTPQLDRLVEAALQAGALGAKLSGAGMGGNVIALAPEGQLESIRSAFQQAGARQVFSTTLAAAGG